MSISSDRLTRNQVIFRKVNERLREVSDSRTETTEYLCECSDIDCVRTIELTERDYRAIRAIPHVFVVIPGHERLEVDVVLTATKNHTLVEKIMRLVLLDPATRTSPKSSEMTTRGKRMLENQITFRNLMERPSEMARIDDGVRVSFLCECADIECLGRLEATLSEFELIHHHRDRLFVLPGHPRMEGEEIVPGTRRYEVVTKATVK